MLKHLRALDALAPASARDGLRQLVPGWAQQRVLAAALTRRDLVRCLSWWLAPDDANALGALAFDGLPQRWLNAAAASAQDSERRCQWCLGRLTNAPASAAGKLRAQDLVQHWWQAFALQQQRSPAALLADLQATLDRPADDTAPDNEERRHCAAWARWLPAAAQVSVPLAGEAASRVRAISLTALMALPPASAQRMLRDAAQDPSTLESLAAQLDTHNSAALLPRLVDPASAAPLAQLLAGLQHQLGASGDNARDAVLLKRQLLAALSWQPPPELHLLTGHLLEWTAAALFIPVPVLAQRVQADAQEHVQRRAQAHALLHAPAGSTAPSVADLPGLMDHWVADRAAVDLGPATTPATSRRQLAAEAPNRAQSGHMDAASPLPIDSDPSLQLARCVAMLRNGGPDASLTATEQRWLHQLADLPGPEPRNRIVQELESPAAARRLAGWLAPDELLRLVSWLRPADAAALGSLWPALQTLAPASDWTAVARALLRELFEQDRPLHAQGLLARTLLALRRSTRQAPPLDEAEARWTGAGNRAAAVDNEHRSLLPPSDNDRDQRAATDAQALADRESLFVGNAGLVLLAPYLPRLFGMLGLLVDDRRFKNEVAAERAVLMSQYLVTGQTASAEPLLLLNKLLCGLPLQASVPREWACSAVEREAADSLLLAVIAHWSALGKTSPAGLRQTFLLREGRLEHRDEAWQLEVPPQTFDMLLDRLPWGYATLRFPWMPEVLHVQWR